MIFVFALALLFVVVYVNDTMSKHRRVKRESEKPISDLTNSVKRLNEARLSFKDSLEQAIKRSEEQERKIKEVQDRRNRERRERLIRSNYYRHQHLYDRSTRSIGTDDI